MAGSGKPSVLPGIDAAHTTDMHFGQAAMSLLFLQIVDTGAEGGASGYSGRYVGYAETMKPFVLSLPNEGCCYTCDRRRLDGMVIHFVIRNAGRMTPLPVLAQCFGE